MVETEKITIPTSDGLELEAEYYQSKAERSTAVLITHPHPQFGGNMWNNVVTGVFRRLVDEDISCLRFNFRAVGGSTGEHGDGQEERRDVKACVDYLINTRNAEKIAICGYSYGAAVACSVINHDDKIKGYAAIAFPWDFMGSYFKEKAQSDKPKLFIQGDRDSIAHYGKFKKHYDYYNEPKKHEIINGTDHFYGGRENEVANFVLEFFKSLI